MASLLGSYSLPLVVVSVFIASLTYLTYKLLADYVYKYVTMRSIPEIGNTYPIIGNALQLRSNGGGRT